MEPALEAGIYSIMNNKSTAEEIYNFKIFMFQES